VGGLSEVVYRLVSSGIGMWAVLFGIEPVRLAMEFDRRYSSSGKLLLGHRVLEQEACNRTRL
jgi:hypothetical protein